MIGLVSRPEEHATVEEFFQLFKTPWEFYDPEKGHYEVLIVANHNIPDTNAKLVVVYGAEKGALDATEEIGLGVRASDFHIKWGNFSVPIYGKALTFSNPTHPLLLCRNSAKPIGYEIRKGEQRILRIGYDLFREVSFLLSTGQPAQNALVPTLDIHIDMLRSWIIETGIPLVEIPPVPAGYKLIVCLTHDVDFISIRQHFIDHSMFGFLYRATVGSVVDFFRSRFSFKKLCENFMAVLTLPFVLLGMGRDPWDQFDHHLELEGNAPSTFFFIPFKNNAGEGFSKKRDKYRAAKYDVDDVSGTIGKLLAHGCEAGVHGIDAWHSVEYGKKELSRLRSVTGQENIGIRMHWLCQNESTFRLLDQAGYHYDSSSGYNDAVGFKAGTTQVYKPVGVKHLLELPLHIQDTALFSPGRMHSGFDYAAQLCEKIILSVDSYKGVLTLLWHQRSLGPERLWGDFYKMLILKLQSKNAWFATAGGVVDWFRMRRLTLFKPNGEIECPRPFKVNGKVPHLVLRKYNCQKEGLTRGLPSDQRLGKSDYEFTEEAIRPFSP
jgi:hypothetical protein